jgi:hypothetical protein
MARAKPNKPYNSAKSHDRRSRDLPHNAEVAAVEVDYPFGLEPGDKIATLRSIRNDPLARFIPIVRSMRRNTKVGDLFRAIGRRPSAARRRSIPPGNMSMAGIFGSRSRRASTRRCCG